MPAGTGSLFYNLGQPSKVHERSTGAGRERGENICMERVCQLENAKRT